MWSSPHFFQRTLTRHKRDLDPGPWDYQKATSGRQGHGSQEGTGACRQYRAGLQSAKSIIWDILVREGASGGACLDDQLGHGEEVKSLRCIWASRQQDIFATTSRSDRRRDRSSLLARGASSASRRTCGSPPIRAHAHRKEV